MNYSVGERVINLKGREIKLRPDFKALERIETLTSKGIMTLMATFGDAGYLHAKDIVYSLYACAESGEGDKLKLNLQEFGQMIVDEGVFEYTETAAEMIRFVMTGGKKKPEEDLSDQKAQEVKK